MSPMHVLDAKRNRIELELVSEGSTRPSGSPFSRTSIDRVARASRAMFSRPAERLIPGVNPPTDPATGAGDRVAVFRDVESGLLRTVHHEIVVRFHADTPTKTRNALLDKLSLRVRSVNVFDPNQLVVHDPERRKAGADLVPMSVVLAESDEVAFATPNFVSEYRRAATRVIRTEQWHLSNLGSVVGQVAGEDVRAELAWRVTRGSPNIVIAVLDDGVDVDHPNLRRAIVPGLGRDFFLPVDDPGHLDPRPKIFRMPFNEMAGNDIHGTPCAGVVAASGRGTSGVAPGCRILPIKIFHGDDLASDARVADAIRYASRNADILSCSWSGSRSPDIALAIEEDAGRLGRSGKGSAVFCAAGNDGRRPAAFPANLPAAICVAASTDGGVRASYSQVGPKLDFCAPSSGGAVGIFTTDVSTSTRGFNLGAPSAGGADGLYTNAFGGTSSATPLAAGIGALALSVHPEFDREALRRHLRASCDRIDTAHGAYDVSGHSNDYGFGRLNASKAVR